MAADVATGAVPTLNGADIEVVVGDDGSVKLNDDVAVVATDIEASNGVIHAIASVLPPEGDGDGPTPGPDTDLEAEAPADDSAAALAGMRIAAAAAAAVLALAV